MNCATSVKKGSRRGYSSPNMSANPSETGGGENTIPCGNRTEKKQQCAQNKATQCTAIYTQLTFIFNEGEARRGTFHTQRLVKALNIL